MTIYSATKILSCNFIDCLHIGKIQITYRSTFLTDEVDVGAGVAIKPLHTFDCGHADCQTLLLEQVQVPVDRAHRQVRDLSLQLSKDSFRGGMIGYGLQVM